MSVPKGSVLGPLLFLISINYLNLAIKYCKIHHFADDTNLSNIDKSPKCLNKLINIGLKNLAKWLNVNKVSLNIKKTDVFIFCPKRKSIDFNLKIKLNGKQLYETTSVKYFGIKIDSKLSWNIHIDDIAIKLIKANSISQAFYGDRMYAQSIVFSYFKRKH